MKRASIVSIGNEILSGLTVDTNAAYLSSQLFSIGIAVVSSYTITDNIESIVRMLKLAAGDADIILITGGLGATDDDLTRQALSKMLGSQLQLQPELLAQMEAFFHGRGRSMPKCNEIQAHIPAGAKALGNEIGTAPGILAEFDGKLFVAMPGVPSEMEQMFEESVLPMLRDTADGQVIFVRKLRCFGTSESAIAEKLGDLMQRGRNPLINCTAHCSVITLHIIASSDNKAKAEKMVEADEKKLRDVLGRLIFGVNDQSLAQVVGKQLAEQKKTIAVAESCTGGLLSKLLTDVPGATSYFNRGWVTYSNEAKIKELGVSAELIEKYGAVSEQVAEAMAQGACQEADADIGVGITGIAGPDGGSAEKPVGLVYISLSLAKKNETKRYVFSHNRDFIRQKAAKTALNMIRLKLQD
ncbi:MAG: competence/damage-inducible protein A [Planctomycetota bacterium]|jgi:nicotinamide-nucleotide amidase